MKPKAVIKITTDIVMTLALLFLMGYQLWGEAAHEWVGAAMFVLFIFHHILNFGFCKSIFKGKYTPVRILRTITDFLVLVDMIMLMYSGIVMSRHVFAFLPIENGMALARRMHILGSYWGFALMSLHLGLHREFFTMIVKKKSEHYTLKYILTVITALTAMYGAAAFIKRHFLTYMFLRSEFVFLDYNESPVLFYADHIALMVLFVFIGYLISGAFRRFAERSGRKKENN